MSRAHLAAILAANALGVALLIAIVIGGSQPMPPLIGGNRSIRDVALALWTFLVPAWFMIEQLWFSPEKRDEIGVERFLAAQNKSRVTWTVAGGAVAILIGATAPNLSVTSGTTEVSSQRPGPSTPSQVR